MKELDWVRRVNVGSMKSPKCEAVRAAFAAYRGDALEVRGVAAESGVSEQPVGFDEIVRGARNRARAAFAVGGCELGVGIEDGLVRIAAPTSDDGCDGSWLNIGAAVVCDGARDTLGLSSGFAYPPGIAAAAARDRTPIGESFDALWREREAAPTGPPLPPSGESIGNIGKLSSGVLTRAEYGRHAVLAALVQWLHPDLYACFSADSSARGAA